MNDPTAPESPQPERLRGRRFYSPGWIAAYSLLCAPIGLGLYGINVTRRGQRVLGGIWIALAAVAFLGLLSAAAMRMRPTGSALAGLVLAVVLFQVEANPYRRGLEQGGVRAAPWPPFLLTLAAVLAVAGVLMVFETE